LQADIYGVDILIDREVREGEFIDAIAAGYGFERIPIYTRFGNHSAAEIIDRVSADGIALLKEVDRGLVVDTTIDGVATMYGEQ
jgi:hypothetical protein